MNGIDKREYEPALHALVAWALREDVGTGDVTSAAIVAAEAVGRGRIRAKEAGVLAGWDAARATFLAADPALDLRAHLQDGDALAVGDCVATLVGRIRSILIAERVALNFLQRLSGIASLTARFCDAVAGSGVRILDTRKTTPGLRWLEKEAVRCGGGVNHRVGLFDAIMIKDNHSAAAGGLAEALRRARRAHPAGGQAGAAALPLIVEARDPAEVEIALTGEVDRILLDNFAPAQIAAAVRRVAASPPPRPQIEVSGGVRLENVREYALPGVDFISIGALTHSAPALDLALDLDLPPSAAAE